MVLVNFALKPKFRGGFIALKNNNNLYGIYEIEINIQFHLNKTTNDMINIYIAD